MARRPRIVPGGLCYHVMNRAVLGLTLFEDQDDYAAFEGVLDEARERVNMRVCGYTIMPNHFHMVLRPRADGDLSAFMRWLTMAHVQRWHAHRHNAGRGHVYQSRFKSFPVQSDGHFLKVCRYVERNPLRAGLVERAEDWPGGSLACRRGRQHPADLLSDWPVDRPTDWLRRVNRPERREELESLRRCVARGQPFGDETWIARIADAMGLESTLRPRGRPSAEKKGA